MIEVPLYFYLEIPPQATDSPEATFLLYRGTLLTRKRTTLGPYSRPMPRALWWSKGGGGRFLMSEVPLYSRPMLTCKALTCVRGFLVQGYLAHKKQPCSRTLHKAHA